MILVLAGTTEGRKVALALQRQGYSVIVSVATDYGGQLLRHAGVKTVISGRLAGQGWIDFLLRHKIVLVVDATHPFAVEVSRQAMAACKQIGIPYWRFERPPLQLPHSSLIHTAPDLPRAVETAFALGKNCFSTLGSKHLAYLVTMARLHGVNITARVLASQTVLTHCRALGLCSQQIFAAQGPFDYVTNRQHYLQSGAEVVLTKESGITGGLREKLMAALDLSLPIVIWQRPLMCYPQVITAIDELLELVAKI